ncbi:hypothetical protein [Streptomyces sp. NBC_01353]|uniref:hypothetical protein n=1 Tax=Streptomyces sp. NBC_01353 TaxID=2903835 RepID=UPI002E3355C8|nr:hypothetical protein [Streptomyces sp. NBC_01353]
MIKNLARGLAALTLTIAPLTAPSTAFAAPAAPAVPAAPPQAATLALADALDQLLIADASRAGYTRDKFARGAGRW